MCFAWNGQQDFLLTDKRKNTERFNRKPVRLYGKNIRNERNTPDISQKQICWYNPDEKASHMRFQCEISHVEKQNRLSGKIIPSKGKPCVYDSFMKKNGSSLQSKKICSDLWNQKQVFQMNLVKQIKREISHTQTRNRNEGLIFPERVKIVSMGQLWRFTEDMERTWWSGLRETEKMCLIHLKVIGKKKRTKRKRKKRRMGGFHNP